MVQRIGGKRGRPAKTPKKGPWRPTPPDGKSLKDVAGTVEDLKWCCDLVREGHRRGPGRAGEFEEARPGGW